MEREEVGDSDGQRRGVGYVPGSRSLTGRDTALSPAELSPSEMSFLARSQGLFSTRSASSVKAEGQGVVGCVLETSSLTLSLKMI